MKKNEVICIFAGIYVTCLKSFGSLCNVYFVWGLFQSDFIYVCRNFAELAKYEKENMN